MGPVEPHTEVADHDLVERCVEQLERDLDRAAEAGPWRELVARLRCLRGIDTLTALGPDR